MAGSAPGKSPLLQMLGIDKSFPGVHALNQVSLQLQRGEVLALVGENGAGKSTLIKILAGAHPPDSGEIQIQGRAVRLTSPQAAQRLGISVIYQEFNLQPEMTVRENLFLGRERTRCGLTRVGWETQEARQLLARIGAPIDPQARCRELSVAQQQLVEIARSLSTNAQILVMDEPTAALEQREVQQLFGIIGELRKSGMGIIYISHRLDEVAAVADRVLVLRDGREVMSGPLGGVSREQLIEAMVGRRLESEFPSRDSRPGEELLRVESLWAPPAVRDVSFRARAGEILGFAGLAGAGRTETMRLIFGADRAQRGRILVRGRPVSIRGPRDAIRLGICLLTEDRKSQGLILEHSVVENFALPNLTRFVRGWRLDHRRQRQEAQRYARDLQIRIASLDQKVAHLSGGNQQKVVLAKWLARNADIVIFDEPTRGIDVGAKYEIYLLMNELVTQGKAIIMISSELPELLGMSDRIVVMHEGQVKGEIQQVGQVSAQDVLQLAMS